MTNNFKEADEIATVRTKTWISKKEACKALGVSLSTINRYVLEGKLTAQKSGKTRASRVFFLRLDIIKLANITLPGEGFDPKKASFI